MAAKPQIKPFLTPKGALVWPKLNAPDTFKNKTTYNTKIAFDPSAPGVQEMITRLEAIRDEALEAERAALKAQGKGALAKRMTTRPVFEEETDEEGEPTGRILFRAKMNASYEDRRTGKIKKMRPNFLDARGQPVDFDSMPEVRSGTIAKLGVKPAATVRESDRAMGVTLYLDAVLVISLVTGQARDGSYYGYEPDEEDLEGGFTAPAKAPRTSYADDDDVDEGVDTDGDDADDDGDDGDF